MYTQYIDFTDTSYVMELQGQVTSGMEESVDKSSILLSDTLPTQRSSGAKVIGPESSDTPPKPEMKKGFHSRRNYTGISYYCCQNKIALKVNIPDWQVVLHFILYISAYFNVGDLNEVTAHQLEDMVFS